MKRSLNAFLIASIVLLSILFASLNKTHVALDLVFWPPIELSIASWLIIAFLIGLSVGGLLVYLNMWFSLRRKIRAHRQQSSTDNTPEPASPVAESERELPAAITHD
jgi:uncharacterized integral membrane protein